MALKYKLTYFTLKGVAEPIRYLLSYHNINFEDIRVDLNEWNSSIKKSTPFGKAPVLDIDGKQLTQSRAICRYLAKIASLAGNDTWEDIQIDIIVDTVEDLRYVAADYRYEDDVQKKSDKREKLFSETFPFYLNKFERIVKENDGHLANKKLTWADIYFVAISEHISFLVGKEILESYSSLKALKDTVQANPSIRKYIDNRPADIMVWD